MSGFSQYTVPSNIDLTIKPIPITTNSELTKGSILNDKSALQNNPISYNAPKLDSGLVNSITNSLTSFLDKVNTQSIQNTNSGQNSNLPIYNYDSLPNYNILPETNKQEEKSNYGLILGVSVAGITIMSLLVIYIIKNKKK